GHNGHRVCPHADRDQLAGAGENEGAHCQQFPDGKSSAAGEYTEHQAEGSPTQCQREGAPRPAEETVAAEHVKEPYPWMPSRGILAQPAKVLSGRVRGLISIGKALPPRVASGFGGEADVKCRDP